MASGIYQIRNILNGHRYIGSAKNIKHRWIRHFSDLNLNRHHSVYMQRAWNKYGQSCFEFLIIEQCDSNLLILREQFYIDMLNPEYNASKKAGRVEFTKERRERMSAAHKGKSHPQSQETRDKIRMALIGKKFSVEHKKKLSELAKNRTKEHNQKISESKKGKPGTWTGRFHSLASRIKMSISRTGKKHTAESRKNMSLAKIGNKNTLGHKLSEEHKAKISKSSKGRIVSAETKIRMSIAASIREQKKRDSA